MALNKIALLLVPSVASFGISQLHAFPKHLHLEEYPDDDFNHILGLYDENHRESRLQSITRLRIADVLLSKKPIDTVPNAYPAFCITLFEYCHHHHHHHQHHQHLHHQHY